MHWLVEVAGFDDLGGVDNGVDGEQHGTEQRGFGFDVLWRHLGGDGHGHGSNVARRAVVLNRLVHCSTLPAFGCGSVVDCLLISTDKRGKPIRQKGIQPHEMGIVVVEMGNLHSRMWKVSRSSFLGVTRQRWDPHRSSWHGGATVVHPSSAAGLRRTLFPLYLGPALPSALLVRRCRCRDPDLYVERH